MLKEVAEKRLSAIREFTELGSGFKIAMRDLEIRGAGNLLGEKQHGHMQDVGYDLYCKMLNEAVKELKGIPVEESFGTVIELDIDAFIPESYVRSESQRLDIYKRIAGIESAEECEDMQDELIDRFGDPPRSVQNLLTVARIKAQAHEVYVKEIAQKELEIRFALYERAKLHPEGLPEFLAAYGGTMKPSYVTFGKEIVNETPNGTMTMPYHKVKTIHFLKNSMVIEDDRGVGIIVSKRGFTKGEYMDCVNFLCEQCSNMEL